MAKIITIKLSKKNIINTEIKGSKEDITACLTSMMDTLADVEPEIYRNLINREVEKSVKPLFTKIMQGK